MKQLTHAVVMVALLIVGTAPLASARLPWNGPKRRLPLGRGRVLDRIAGHGGRHGGERVEQHLRQQAECLARARTVTTFMIETYTPTTATLDAFDQSLRGAAAALSAEGVDIVYLRSILVPDDDTCFFVLEATDEEAVHEVARRAELEDPRVTRAIESAT
jgi:hypothetical protein